MKHAIFENPISEYDCVGEQSLPSDVLENVVLQIGCVRITALLTSLTRQKSLASKSFQQQPWAVSLAKETDQWQRIQQTWTLVFFGGLSLSIVFWAGALLSVHNALILSFYPTYRTCVYEGCLRIFRCASQRLQETDLQSTFLLDWFSDRMQKTNSWSVCVHVALMWNREHLSFCSFDLASVVSVVPGVERVCSWEAACVDCRSVQDTNSSIQFALHSICAQSICMFVPASWPESHVKDSVASRTKQGWPFRFLHSSPVFIVWLHSLTKECFQSGEEAKFPEPQAIVRLSLPVRPSDPVNKSTAMLNKFRHVTYVWNALIFINLWIFSRRVSSSWTCTCSTTWRGPGRGRSASSGRSGPKCSTQAPTRCSRRSTTRTTPRKRSRCSLLWPGETCCFILSHALQSSGRTQQSTKF